MHGYSEVRFDEATGAAHIPSCYKVHMICRGFDSWMEPPLQHCCCVYTGCCVHVEWWGGGAIGLTNVYIATMIYIVS